MMTKSVFHSNDIHVGDRITLDMIDFGPFTATVQQVSEEEILFLFDDIIAYRSINQERTNKGSFEKSDMNQWLHDMILPRFPVNYRDKVADISIPTYGQIFGHYHQVLNYKRFVPDNDQQFELMTDRWYRIKRFHGHPVWWWLRNPIKQSISSTSFACVRSDGLADFNYASLSFGVRPEFWLVR